MYARGRGHSRQIADRIEMAATAPGIEGDKVEVLLARSGGTDTSGRPRHSHPRMWKAPHEAGLSVQLDEAGTPYIIPSIPPMPPGGIAGPSSFFGFSATVASVVISNPAMDAAFCSAARTTFVGSRIPIFTRSPYSSV